MAPPWTNDPILQEYKFTNVYRASDRVSQYLIRRVAYFGDQSEEEIFFRTILFKLFNRISTWELFERCFGTISWKTFNLARYDAILSNELHRGEKLYSAAYIMPCPPFGAPKKHTNHLMLLDKMMKDNVPAKVANATSLEHVFSILRAYPSIGDFLAFQFAIDLNYTNLINFSEMDFVVPGPGARSGLRKVFRDSCGLSDEDVIRAMAEQASEEFERYALPFRNLWGRSLQLIDCQNLFCEVDKYARVAFPDANGSGRARIKQRYRSGLKMTEQWYPPKWGIKPSVPERGSCESEGGCQYRLFSEDNRLFRNVE